MYFLWSRYFFRVSNSPKYIFHFRYDRYLGPHMTPRIITRMRFFFLLGK